MFGALLSENAFCLGRGKRRAFLSEAAFAALLTTLMPTSDALAAGCVRENFNFSVGIGDGVHNKDIVPTPSAFGSLTNTINTAFLTNATSFVSSPPNPQPGQASGGVWARAIAGYTDTTVKSTTEVGIFPFTHKRGFAKGTENCVQTSHQEYAGIQVGSDIAKLSIGNSGANLHFGITGGYLGAKLQDTTPQTGPFFFPNTDLNDGRGVPA